MSYLDPIEAAWDTPVHEPQMHVLEWHQKFGAAVGRAHKPSLEDYPVELRIGLVEEECRELVEAMKGRDLVGMCKDACDVLYVVYGAMVSAGVNLAPVFAEVHASNMAKDGATTREDGKIVKPPGWEKPDVRSILQMMGADV